MRSLPSLRSTPPTQRITHKAGLRREADRGICGAEAGVGAPLDKLEEKSAVEGLGVDLEIFSRALTVVEHVVGAQPVERPRLQVDAGLEIVVVVFRDRQEFDSSCPQPLGRCKDVACGKSDML